MLHIRVEPSTRLVPLKPVVKSLYKVNKSFALFSKIRLNFAKLLRFFGLDVPTLEVDENAALQIRPIKSQWKVEVRFNGYPTPTITWTKNDETIKDEKCKTYVDAGSTTIAIYSVEKTNTGVYTVIATNTAGSAAANLQLKVIGS